ncbi:MAG: septal ring lytic transglycosylase RlpA family protein [Hyphomicrobiaceae bacterium]|nr:septal ring lytic transglycosylase RlpA family protein [Hyphomicrobiaceae bacterium]
MTVTIKNRQLTRGGDVLAYRFILIALILLCAINTAHAKTPGKYKCYRTICWRVATTSQIDSLLGASFMAQASYYDTKSRDLNTPNDFTSSGELFNPDGLDRVASPNLPNGTKILLRHPKTGITAYAIVNDTGPFKGHRVIDVPITLANTMDFTKAGIASLQVVIIASPSSQEMRYRPNRKYEFKGGVLGHFTSLRKAVEALLSPEILSKFDSINIEKPELRSLSFGRIIRRPQIKHTTKTPEKIKRSDTSDDKMKHSETARVKKKKDDWRKSLFELY